MTGQRLGRSSGGPRLGDVEASAVASLTSPRFSVLSGGLACVVAAGIVVAAFPALARYKDEAIAAMSSESHAPSTPGVHARSAADPSQAG